MLTVVIHGRVNFARGKFVQHQHVIFEMARQVIGGQTHHPRTGENDQLITAREFAQIGSPSVLIQPHHRFIPPHFLGTQGGNAFFLELHLMHRVACQNIPDGRLSFYGEFSHVNVKDQVPQPWSGFKGDLQGFSLAVRIDAQVKDL